MLPILCWWGRQALCSGAVGWQSPRGELSCPGDQPPGRGVGEILPAQNPSSPAPATRTHLLPPRLGPQPRVRVLTRLVVPQAVKGNRNRAKAGVATAGRHSLSFPRPRRTESRSRGGEVTLRATATVKWPSRLQREVTATAEAAQGRLSVSLGSRRPREGGTGSRDWVPSRCPCPARGSLMGAPLPGTQHRV